MGHDDDKVGLCGGCDNVSTDGADVKPYRVTLRADDTQPRRVVTAYYCDVCADLARVDWPGTIEAIEPLVGG